MVSFYPLKLYNIKPTPLPKTEDFEKQDLEKNTHNKMAFYQQIRTNSSYQQTRKNSQIASEAKKDASDAKVAYDNVLRSDWIDTNWTPLKELLEHEILFASDQGEFSGNVIVSIKSFKYMSDSPLFKTDIVHLSILGFIKLISKSCEEDLHCDILNEFESISWAHKGFLDGFVIKHAVEDYNFEDKHVVFHISWNH